ncbi:MAG: hypothetical protein AB7T06_10765 [Kofleriaceae bacterium]
MQPAHYIVFHPEQKRQAVAVHAHEVVDGGLKAWSGDIWVDAPPDNEDPFVFREPWLYSYCHATELRRAPNKRADYIQVGSVIVFASGSMADAGMLLVDTVFVVGRVERWPEPARLPERYAHERDQETEVWKRHLVFC